MIGINTQVAFANTDDDSTDMEMFHEIPNNVNLSEDEIDKDTPLAKTEVRKITDDPNYLKKQQFNFFSNSITPFGAGKWDEIGESTFKFQSKTMYSGGGDLLIYFEQPYGGFGGPKWWYKLYEEDSPLEQVVSSFELPNQAGSYEMRFDARGWVDGDNNKAELHLVKLYYPTDSVYTLWLD